MIGSTHPLAPPYPKGQEVPPEGCECFAGKRAVMSLRAVRQTTTTRTGFEFGPTTLSLVRLFATSFASTCASSTLVPSVPTPLVATDPY